MFCVIALWSANTAGLPETVCAPAVIFVAVATTLNSPVPGVPVTLFNCVVPLNTSIVVPEPVYVTVPVFVVGNVCASLLKVAL